MADKKGAMARATELLDGIVDEFDDLFDPTRWLQRAESRIERSTEVTTSKKVYRTTEDDEGMTLEVDLPGVDPKTVRLWRSGNVLTLEGTRADGKGFSHRYTVNFRYDLRTTQAKMAHGMLSARVRGTVHPEPVAIPIEL